MPASRTARSTVLAPLLPLVAALAVWAPLRHNFFWNDDFVHLYDIATRSLWSYSSELFLGQFYLVRNLVFAGLFHAFGPDPRPYFWSVLLTHAVNVLLLERATGGSPATWSCPASAQCCGARARSSRARSAGTPRTGRSC
jgi:hypothetical protein